MKKLISVGILGLLLIAGSISATCLTLDNNSEKSIMNYCNPLDDMCPVTSIFYNPETGMVTLIAEDLPIHMGGVKATYYKIDGGSTQIYVGAFFIGEGTHTVEYWSVDNVDNEEYHKKATFTFDSTPPTVKIIKPALGTIYLFDKYVFGSRIPSRVICIGKLNISVNADDGDGTGVNTVYFTYANETGYDDNGSDGWTDINSESHFGEITIVVTAIDNKGLMSEPVQRKVFVYSLGLI